MCFLHFQSFYVYHLRLDSDTSLIPVQPSAKDRKIQMYCRIQNFRCMVREESITKIVLFEVNLCDAFLLTSIPKSAWCGINLSVRTKLRAEKGSATLAAYSGALKMIYSKENIHTFHEFSLIFDPKFQRRLMISLFNESYLHILANVYLRKKHVDSHKGFGV